MPLALLMASHSLASEIAPPSQFRHQSVPVLGVTLNKAHQPVGIVMYVMIHFRKRSDSEGLRVSFRAVPGRFDTIARKSVATSIDRVAKFAKLQNNSWTVILTFPYPGLIMHGDSLSAMVALSVLAFAKGHAVIYGRTITGTVRENGRIGAVTGIPYKVYAAYSERLDRVFVPEEHHPRDDEWQTPFLMHASFVGTLEKAYQGLTGKPLFPKKF